MYCDFKAKQCNISPRKWSISGHHRKFCLGKKGKSQKHLERGCTPPLSPDSQLLAYSRCPRKSTLSFNINLLISTGITPIVGIFHYICVLNHFGVLYYMSAAQKIFSMLQLSLCVSKMKHFLGDADVVHLRNRAKGNKSNLHSSADL